MVSSGGISAEVKELILRDFDSVELLEVLLLLRRYPNERWTIDSICKEIRTDPMSIEIRTEQLRKKGYVGVHYHDEIQYAYEPSSGSLARAVDALAECYWQRRTAVIELIFSRPQHSIRNFADAFRLRRD